MTMSTPPTAQDRWDLRNEFQQLVFGELHGPADGPEEIVDPRVYNGGPRERYLVGMLAPKDTVAIDPARADTLGVDGDDTPEGSDADRSAAAVRLFPNSLGLTFAVHGDFNSVQVTARWGQYESHAITDDDPESPTATASGERSVWKRHQERHTLTVDLSDETVGPLPVHPDEPDVVIRGRARQVNGHRLVSLYLINNRPTPERGRDRAYLFQAQLEVAGVDGQPVFIGRDTVLGDVGDPTDEDELARLDLLYRNTVEFAAGHSVGVHAEPDPADPSRATRLTTHAVPEFEVPRTDFPTASEGGVYEQLAEAEFDMAELAKLEDGAVSAALTPIVAAYRAWIDAQEQQLGDPAHRVGSHVEAAEAAIVDARLAADRIEAGIELLGRDDGTGADARDAFRFANEVMGLQRIHTITAEERANDSSLDYAAKLAEADVPRNRSWRPFQLAFLLLNLPSLTVPDHPDRATDGAGIVDLLFFPTGGGKTEAYLGLAAYTMGIRRLQGEVGGFDGSDGVAILMRYTLRLLTAQQFQRAAAMVCAAEYLRRGRVDDDPRWGETPFRLGLWVGSGVTPMKDKDAAAAVEEARDAGYKKSGRSSPLQLNHCPWCGHTLRLDRDVKPDSVFWRTFIFCPDDACDFTEAATFDEAAGFAEGLPVLTVDEHIYRLLPAFVIATVDKFAQLPWRGPLHLLFGKATHRCSRHGYRSPDMQMLLGQRKEADTHRSAKQGRIPAASTLPVLPLRPPDLIIQDELHLISGPLGSLVGLYETAIDDLSTWEYQGTKVRPKVVASTATVRRAQHQAHRLFYRGLEVFPPPVIDADDSFFGKQREPSPDQPGRRYVGICAHGNRLKAVEVRVYTAVLAAAQKLFDTYGEAADPYMTLVGYFGSLRELGGARRLVDDDIAKRLQAAQKRGLARRPRLIVEELTSRINSTEIPRTLDQLKVPFRAPETDDEGKRVKPDAWPIDVLLATNMISVGVDVGRLGLMVVTGQPKATAEYIQSTSRVGRTAEAPGIVFTIYNWARPRDLSHYERFEHYHATFYRQVEALSVTPFAGRAIWRGLTAVLVAEARHGAMNLDWNPNETAQTVDTNGAFFDDVVDRIAARAEGVTADPAVGQLVRDEAQKRLDLWFKLQQRQAVSLVYSKPKDAQLPLLVIPEAGGWSLQTAPNSLRETEAPVNLLVVTEDASMASGMPGFSLGAGQAPSAPAIVTAEDDEAEVAE